MIAQSIVLLAILFALFFVGNHYEHRLGRIAQDSEKGGQQAIAGEYWRVSGTYYVVGSPVIAAILLLLYLMIVQQSIF